MFTFASYANTMRHLLLLLTLLPFTLWAQEGTIKGKILDKATKQPLPGVVVQLKDSPLNTVTDSSGAYVLPKVEEGNKTILINMMGYVSRTLLDVQVVRGKTYYTETELQEEVVTAEEVTVTGFKHENDPTSPVSTYGFSREEIFRNPGAQGDIFRAIGMLPGVSSSGGQYSAIAVRGQGTRDNVYMVDDIPMTDLSHLEGNSTGFQDPNGGRFSIFGPKVINEAKFQGGGFSALYGRKSSSYLGLSIKEGNKESATVDGQFDLLGFTLNYDGPTKIHKNTSLFLSVRYQDFRVLLSMIGRTDIGSAYYGDIIAKTTTEINKNNKLSVLLSINPEGFGRNIDAVKADKELVFQNMVPNGTTFRGLAGLNLRTLLNSKSYLRNVAYYRTLDGNVTVDKAHIGVTESGLLDEKAPISLEKKLRRNEYREYEAGYRLLYNYRFDNKSTLTAGGDLQLVGFDIYRYLSRPDTAYSFSSSDIQNNPSQKFLVTQPQYYNNDQFDQAMNASAYTEYSFEPLKRLTVNAGLRYDYTGFIGTHTLSPRLSSSYELDEKNSVSLATGVFYQDPIYFLLADQPKEARLKNERVFQLILGYKHYFRKDIKLTVEPWYKSFDQLVVRPLTGARFLNNDGTGYAYGIDFNVTKRLTKKYHGQIGYSFLTSKRDDHDGTGEYNYTYSQPNQFNVLLSYQANKRWILSSKFRYATGRPADQYAVYSNVLNDPSHLKYSRELVAKGGDRFPDFVSFDIRADYRVQLSRMAFAAFIDVVNVFNRFNINTVNFNEYNGKDVNDGVAIFPTFGVRFEY